MLSWLLLINAVGLIVIPAVSAAVGFKNEDGEEAYTGEILMALTILTQVVLTIVNLLI